MDARSRYQNYKRVKDPFFIHGFSPHPAQHLIGSSCQRRAVTIAARKLGIEKEVKDFYCSKDVQSYHFRPHLLLKNPLFVFHPYLWTQTFIEIKNHNINFSKSPGLKECYKKSHAMFLFAQHPHFLPNIPPSLSAIPPIPEASPSPFR